MRYFDTVHPAAAAFYFISVMCTAIFTSNPVLQVSALFGGLMFCAVLIDVGCIYRRAFSRILLFLLISIANPLFVHSGNTVLFRINGKSITLEAALCGVSIAVMLLLAVVWFECFNSIMTSDKLLFLFSGLLPKLSLLICTALRFVPLLKSQAKKIRTCQKGMGLYSTGGFVERLRAVLRTYSALITWSLESSINTGMSMQGRCYLSNKRTCYYTFHFKLSDCVISAFTAITDITVITAALSGKLEFEFYPQITATVPGTVGITALTMFALLTLLPFIMEIGEKIRWRCYRSKI